MTVGLMPTWQDNLLLLLLQLPGAPAGLPSGVSVAAYTDLPSLDEGYAGTQPAAADGYAGPVAAVGAAAWTWAGATTGLATNAALGLGTPTADWGPIVGWALISDDDGSVITEPVAFDDPIDFPVGVPAQFLADQLGLQVTGSGQE